MNFLFLSLIDFNSILEHNIYSDLLRELVKRDNSVYVVSPIERKKRRDTYVIYEENATILKVKIGNIQKTNIFEKGISTLLIERQLINAIKKHLKNVKFDVVLYSTPPVTFCRVVHFIKNRDSAFSYLLLKDIFPQNAADIGMLKKDGIKGLIFKFFKRKEINLYQISNYIGCMSQANVDYLVNNNPEVDMDKVGICPNSIEPIDKSVNEEVAKMIRNKYEIPLNKKVFVYGGNLGKPQGIPFLIECLKSQIGNDKVFFLIVGDGTEYGLLDRFVKNSNASNIKLMKRLPKDDYDTLVGACDVGLIFLDHRFTIPNFPSRLLSYMQAKIPVLAVTDPNTDIGKVIQDGKFGWWCESNDVNGFNKAVCKIIDDEDRFCEMGEQAYTYLHNNFDVTIAANTILKAIKDE